ncbi:MAG: adenylate/guanylate cyclase domain-containing protein [Leptospirales bacterium]|jgi:adenylate cyclase
MKTAPVPADEEQRLAALRKFEILDTQAEVAFDELTQLAARILGTPMSLISIVDSARNWIKSGVGVDAGSESMRDTAFCAHAVAQNEIMVVPNLTEDERFVDHPMVVENGVRFYAGQQLTTEDGHNIGTLCVLDSKPREINASERETLRILGRQVMSQLELRRSLKELTMMNRKALALEGILRRYTSRSIWERADVSATSGDVFIKDEKAAHVCLFLDIVSFTGFAETHPAEEVIATLNEYFQPIVQIIHEHGGDVDKFVGDQVFAIFDDAAEAVHAALAIRVRIEELGRSRSERGLTPMEFRIGLNHGPVVRGNVGGETRRDNTLIGDVVNVAARLQSACEPGLVLASQSVVERMGGVARIDRRLKYKLKGKNEPVVACYLSAKP